MLLQKQQIEQQFMPFIISKIQKRRTVVNNHSNEDTTSTSTETETKTETPKTKRKENFENFNFNCCRIGKKVQENGDKSKGITALAVHVPNQKEITTEQQQLKPQNNVKHVTIINTAQQNHFKKTYKLFFGNMSLKEQFRSVLPNESTRNKNSAIDKNTIKNSNKNNNNNYNHNNDNDKNENEISIKGELESNRKFNNDKNHQKNIAEKESLKKNNKRQQHQERKHQKQQEQEKQENGQEFQYECEYDGQPNTRKKTIDFNSRRRRGRLRSNLVEWTFIAFAQKAIAINSFNRIVPAICNKIRLATLKRNAAVKNVAHHIMLSLSLLLTFIVDYVNRKKFLILWLNGYLNAHTHNIHKNLWNNIITSLGVRLVRLVREGFKFKKKKQKNGNGNEIANKSNEIQKEYFHKFKRSTFGNDQRSDVTFYCNKRFINAFIFCVMILLLPCGNNVANAAKPKSATQLQKQDHQHQHDQHDQQMEEHPHYNQKQHAGGVAFDSRGNGVLTPPSYQIVPSQTSNEDAEFAFPSLLSEEFDDEMEQLEARNSEEGIQPEIQYSNATQFDNTTITKTPLFPKDLFTKEQLERGAVIFHIMGVIYMFVALAIVCDEFFVPSLDVIIEKLGITDDVAGATFMAAGGSAPELFTSVIGVFVSFDDVGIGTIVGSAVFNILFVIGMCALFSKTVLSLTWWPLFRDCSFYSISLLVLIYFFRDNRIYWWEALILFFIYIAYVAFMKWNVQVERCVKKVITKNKVTRVRSTDQLMPAGNAANSSETSMATQPGGSVTSRAASETRSGPAGSSSGAGTTGNSSGGAASSTQTGAKFRHGLLQLMIHTIDPLHDDDVPGKVDEKATQLHAIASLKVLLDATKPQRGAATTSAANHVKINLKETTLADRPNGNIDTTLDSPSLSGRRPSWIEQRVKIQTRKFSIKTNEIEEEPEPLSMAWPDTARKRLTYILVAPLLIPMWLTLPDTRTPRGKKYFPVTFIGSIVWIAAFSYLMVWWANVAGDTARIPPEVMGLTFLAAGTSIPDLITSVIVARKGFGDMAVSSSVGSNIFDVTVGLPIPWLLYGIIYSAPVEVNSVGMVCSITILFMMLLFVVMSIACFRWRMNKGLGFTMFLLYFVFVAVSLMFEYDLITCPV